MRNPRLIVAGLLACALATTAACGTAAGGGSDSLTVGMSSPVMAQEGQQALADGFTAAAASLGWGERVYDANLSADTQVSNVQTMVAQNNAAIAAWALDDGAISGAYAGARAANIPVVGINSAGSGVTTSVWWEVNTCEAGGTVEKLAQLFATAKPGGNIAIISGPPAPSIVALTECFTAAAEQAGLTVVARQDNTQDSSAGASALAQDLLSAHPDLDGFWAYNDASALGISSAILASGRTVHSGTDTEGLVVTGVNGDSAAITAVRNGTVTATVDTDPACTGWAVVGAMQSAVQDAAATPQRYVVRSAIVDSSAVGSFVAPADRTCSLTDLPLVD